MEEMLKVEKKYKDMDDGVLVLSEKVKRNDVISTMTNNFRVFLGKKDVSLLNASILSDIFGFSLIMFEEVLEKERKERFSEFVFSTFSREFLKGKEENLLYTKILERMKRKMTRNKKSDNLKK